MNYDRPGCFFLPSHEIALHFARRAEREVVGSIVQAPATPSAATQAEPCVTDAAEGATIVIDPSTHPALCNNLRCFICYGGCRWCGVTLPPVQHDERDEAVIRALGRICQACGERQERVR